MSDLPIFASAFLDIFQSQRLDRSAEALDSLSIDDAYRVQQMVLDTRIDQGEHQAGYKVGCTSEAIRQQFGLTEPICGRVMAPFVYHGDTVLNLAAYCQPAVEPEFVITIGKDLRNEVSEDEPMEHAIDCVSPGIEVHHYRFWFGEPTIQELIASNGIHAALIIGAGKVAPQQIQWPAETVSLSRNGRIEASGSSAEIMGGPLKSLRWLVNHLVRRGEALKAGEVVIPGSPVELVSVQGGDRVISAITNVGQVEAVFE